MYNDQKKIFNFIKRNLQDNYEEANVLSADHIDSEINSIKKLFNTAPGDVLKNIFALDNVPKVDEFDWLKIKRDIEKHFNVQIEEGVLIQGIEQKERNNEWWTNRSKQQTNMFFWNRYRDYLSKKLPLNIVRGIDTDTDVVMDNMGDPSNKTFSRYGMVVGHVQSGKTANYSALICKACDAGYKFIVVIAGGTNNLRNQTQTRINESVIGKQGESSVGVGKMGNNSNAIRPCSLTTETKDFNKRDADKNSQTINFDNISVPIIMVIKKNASTLKNVIKWLEAQYSKKIEKHAMLLIDDESDYASINYKGEDDPTTINKRLRKLLNIFHKSVYVAYTATPYANIFIDYKIDSDDLGRDLFPKDFIYALAAPSNYLGAREVFLNQPDNYIIDLNDNEGYIPLKHKKDCPINELPPSLKKAIRMFVLNIAIRQKRGEIDENNSMLIHVSRFTAIHQTISFHVDNYLEKLRNEIIAYSRLPGGYSSSVILSKLKDTYHDYYNKVEVDWEELNPLLANVIKTIVVREVHQKSKIDIDYTQKGSVNVIAVGGASLSRGYTLEGLSVSYFLRTTKTYDTLMQMGRWFGYRDSYQDLCRIFMTEEMADYFKNICEATEDLYDDFNRMRDAKKTPDDFGLSVKQYPDSALQVTARNKLRNAKDFYFEMRLDGLEKETTYLSSDFQVIKSNIKAVEELLDALSNRYYEKFSNKKNKYFWENVPSDAVLTFLENYNVYTKNPFRLIAKMPIEFIKDYARTTNLDWDILFASGNSTDTYSYKDISFKKPIRTFVKKNDEDVFEINQRQISSEGVERIVFTENELMKYGTKRKDLRSHMKKPLLVIYMISPKFKEEIAEKIDTIAAFGISFPGGVASNSRIIKSKINPVYIDQIREAYDEGGIYDE